jgi:hypothetical protein
MVISPTQDKLHKKRQELHKECTFQPNLSPKVRSSPGSSTGKDGTPVKSYDRLYQLASKNQAKLHAKRAEKEKECTFKPTITSRANIKRGESSPHDRLYKLVRLLYPSRTVQHELESTPPPNAPLPPPTLRPPSASRRRRRRSARRTRARPRRGRRYYYTLTVILVYYSKSA